MRSMLIVIPLLAGCQWLFPPQPCNLPVGTGGACRTGDSTTVVYVEVGDRLVAVWTDIPLNSSGAGAGCGFGSASVDMDGRIVELFVMTKDGLTFQINVNGTIYSDVGGTLFLVRTQGPDPGVRRLSRDLHGLAPTEDTWRQIAKDDADVMEFMSQVEGKK